MTIISRLYLKSNRNMINAETGQEQKNSSPLTHTPRVVGVGEDANVTDPTTYTF